IELRKVHHDSTRPSRVAVLGRSNCWAQRLRLADQLLEKGGVPARLNRSCEGGQKRRFRPLEHALRGLCLLLDRFQIVFGDPGAPKPLAGDRLELKPAPVTRGVSVSREAVIGVETRAGGGRLESRVVDQRVVVNPRAAPSPAYLVRSVDNAAQNLGARS